MPQKNEALSLLLIKARENSVACIKPILTRYDLTEQQWRVIRALYQMGESNAQDLAEQACILSPSLSRILSRLTTDGIVLRKAKAEDQRAQHIRLSAKGKRLHDKIQPAIEKQYQALSDNVGSDKLNKLMVLLEKYSVVGEEVSSA